MIISSTPMRISLFGGSTDHPEFIKRYQKSQIISFTSNLYTHVCLSKDKYGFNTHQKSYLVNYSKREVKQNISKISNELVSSVFSYYKMPPCSVYLTSDIYSSGNGLASSSAYLLSLIKACEEFTNGTKSKYEIAKLALQIERTFNPYCGFQDPFGCIYQGLKSISSKDDNIYKIKNFKNKIFDLYDFFLFPTGFSRNSKKILNELAKSADKLLPLYNLAMEAKSLLIKEDFKDFIKLISQSWFFKKKTSNLIQKNKKIADIDEYLGSQKNIIAHKLLGAGNGGFFLIVQNKNSKQSKVIIDKSIPLL